MNNAGSTALAFAEIKALQASGCIVSVTPEVFQSILQEAADGWVVVHRGGVFHRRSEYLVSHKGFIFHARSHWPLQLPPTCRVIEAERLWIPQ